MTILEQLGAQVARCGRDSTPAPEEIGLRIADTVGAWVAGGHTPEGRALLAFALPQDGSKPGGTLDRVATHCALARLSEIDDIHLASCTTPGSVIVPAVLTVAGDMECVGGADVSAAIAAGYEALVRLGAAIDGPRILYRGIWPTYLCAPFGAAAAVARLLRLDERQAAHALSLALILAAPGVGQQGGPMMSRWLAMGNAARNGCTAAFAARAGFTADLGAFERDYLASVLGIRCDAQALVAGIGAAAALHQVSFKPWCAARQTMAATQALAELVAGGIAPDEITAVSVSVPEPYLKMIDHGVTPGERSSYLTSVTYQMALAAYLPAARFDIGQTPQNLPQTVPDFMRKVSVAADSGLLGFFPEKWPARVVLRARGAEFEKLVLEVPGGPGRGFDRAQVEDKFRHVVAPVLGDAAAPVLFGLGVAAAEEDGGVSRLLRAIAQFGRE